jgi:integrase
MRLVLTDRFVRSLRPASNGERTVIWDVASPGFGVRVTGRGVVSFFVMRRQAGKPTPIRVTLGTYPNVRLAEARAKAADALKALAEGDHPREIEKRRQRAQAEHEAKTFESIAEQFIQRHVSRLRTSIGVEKAIRREFIPRWGDRPISEITRGDIISMIEEVVDRGTPHMARNLLAYARKLWNWALARDYGLDSSPCDRVKAADLIGSNRPRQRILTNAELRVLWYTTEGYAFPFDPFIRLLLILGCRRGELAKMARHEVDLVSATWRLPGDRTKSEHPRLLPLPKLAVQMLGSLPVFPGPYFFCTAGGQPISGFSDFKERLDARIAATAAGTPNWRLHDLRRTMRTHLSALRIEQHVREMMIGHKQIGITGTYDLHAYEAEQRDGFEQWSARLSSIVESSS